MKKLTNKQKNFSCRKNENEMHMAQKADNKAMNNVSREWRNKLINVNGS